jgi:hypothetical protein
LGFAIDLRRTLQGFWIYAMSELDQAFVSLGIADQRVAICERLVAQQIACVAKM